MQCAAHDLLVKEYRWGIPQVEAVDRYLYRESRCEPHPLPQRHLCGGPCYGAFQWDARRWRNGVRWMRARGLDPAVLDSQVHWAVHEWLTVWPRASSAFLRETSPRRALRIWDNWFGRGRIDR